MAEEAPDFGEYGVGDTAREALGEIFGDFRLIKEGDVLFLNSKIEGDAHGEMCGERRFDMEDELEESLTHYDTDEQYECIVIMSLITMI